MKKLSAKQCSRSFPFADPNARGDYILWLHEGKLPASNQPFCDLLSMFKVGHEPPSPFFPRRFSTLLLGQEDQARVASLTTGIRLPVVQELHADLENIMHLQPTKSEYQLGYYPPDGSQYVRHR